MRVPNLGPWTVKCVMSVIHFSLKIFAFHKRNKIPPTPPPTATKRLGPVQSQLNILSMTSSGSL